MIDIIWLILVAIGIVGFSVMICIMEIKVRKQHRELATLLRDKAND